MNKFFIIFLLLAVVAAVKSDSSEEILDEVSSKHLKKLLKSKSGSIERGLKELEEKCPGVSDKLKGAVKIFSECDDKVDDSLTICQAIQSSALNCTAPLVKVVSDCLPEHSRGLPQLGVKSLVSVAGYLCHLNGESIFELANPCIFNKPEENECERNFTSFLQKIEEKIPSDNEVCSALSTLRSCQQNHGGLARCKNKKTRDAVNGLAEAILAPCNA